MNRIPNSQILFFYTFKYLSAASIQHNQLPGATAVRAPRQSLSCSRPARSSTHRYLARQLAKRNTKPAETRYALRTNQFSVGQSTGRRVPTPLARVGDNVSWKLDAPRMMLAVTIAYHHDSFHVGRHKNAGYCSRSFRHRSVVNSQSNLVSHAGTAHGHVAFAPGTRNEGGAFLEQGVGCVCALTPEQPGLGLGLRLMTYRTECLRDSPESALQAGAEHPQPHLKQVGSSASAAFRSGDGNPDGDQRKDDPGSNDPSCDRGSDPGGVATSAIVPPINRPGIGNKPRTTRTPLTPVSDAHQDFFRHNPSMSLMEWRFEQVIRTIGDKAQPSTGGHGRDYWFSALPQRRKPKEAKLQGLSSEGRVFSKAKGLRALGDCIGRLRLPRGSGASRQKV
ncbi:hypothetical protein B0H13DRAFT_2263834 [Mycena leptocephala]|nr:hypothetical protein B0H13DRAFT_2263834 [Mycena leptocephala]